MTIVKLEKHEFEGPLDVLLGLIEDKKLRITEVSLADVTEQFLAHVRSLEAASPVVLADFLAVAAKLLVIKSRAILPEITQDIEEADSARDLEQQLIVYKQYKDIAKSLGRFSLRLEQSFIRQAVFQQRISFFPDTSLSPQVLHTAILNIARGLEELDNLPKARVKEAISIQEKITHLQNLLSNSLETRLSAVLANAKTKSEAIVTFLALLELIKQQILVVEQEDSFAEITIRKFAVETNVGTELG